jgi:hypothetical protein
VIEEALHTSSMPPPEVLVRSSGEIRFSDFMLWQLNHSMLYFVDLNWPEMNLFQIFKFILNYQLHVCQHNFRKQFDHWIRPLKRDESLIALVIAKVKYQVNQMMNRLQSGKCVQNKTIHYELK